MNRHQKNVLIIEHEAIIALDVKKRLENHGYNIIGLISTLDETLKNLKNLKDVDLILLDSGVTDFSNNILVAEKIYKFIKTPLLLLTSHIDDHINSLCSKYKSVKIIEKPFENEELIDAVGNILSDN